MQDDVGKVDFVALLEQSEACMSGQTESEVSGCAHASHDTPLLILDGTHPVCPVFHPQPRSLRAVHEDQNRVRTAIFLDSMQVLCTLAPRLQVKDQVQKKNILTSILGWIKGICSHFVRLTDWAVDVLDQIAHFHPELCLHGLEQPEHTELGCD